MYTDWTSRNADGEVRMRFPASSEVEGRLEGTGCVVEIVGDGCGAVVEDGFGLASIMTTSEEVGADGDGGGDARTPTTQGRKERGLSSPAHPRRIIHDPQSTTMAWTSSPPRTVFGVVIAVRFVFAAGVLVLGRPSVDRGFGGGQAALALHVANRHFDRPRW